MFINERLNKALKRSETRNEQLTSKIKRVNDESVCLKKELMESKLVVND